MGKGKERGGGRGEGKYTAGGRGEGKYTAVPPNPIAIDINFLVAITLT